MTDQPTPQNKGQGDELALSKQSAKNLIKLLDNSISWMEWTIQNSDLARPDEETARSHIKNLEEVREAIWKEL